MEPGATKLSDEVRRIGWAFSSSDNRRDDVLRLSAEVKRLEDEHAELLETLKVFADGETIIRAHHVQHANVVIARIESGR